MTKMYYYQIDTPKGMRVVKTYREIKSKGTARRIVGFENVNWFSRINPATYYFCKIFRHW